MWNRAQLKQNAKNVLQRNYWMAVLVSLVAGLLSGSSGSAGGSGSSFAEQAVSGGQIDLITASVFTLIVILAAAAAMLIGLAFAFFISGPVQIGKSRYYLESREQKSSFGRLFFTFSHSYMNSAAAMFVTNRSSGCGRCCSSSPASSRASRGRRYPTCWPKTPA